MQSLPEAPGVKTLNSPKGSPQAHSFEPQWFHAVRTGVDWEAIGGRGKESALEARGRAARSGVARLEKERSPAEKTSAR